MTVSSVSSVQPTDYAAQAQAVRAQQPPPKAAALAGDSVQISSAAKSALAGKPAEALETPAQTAQEAAGGDPMALAKQAKAKSSL